MENKKNKPINIIHKISDKTIAITMALGLLISLIPIVVLAFYNYPCADDFSASDTAHWAWQETGSLWEVIKAAWENVVYNYENWSGVYTSVFWTSMQPGLFGEKFYGITTVISVILFVVAGFYLTYVIGKHYVKGNAFHWGAICILYLFTSIHCMPDGNEGLYWHAGGANYTWAFAFLLMLTGCILAIYKEKNKKKLVIEYIVSCLLAILVGGGNYITALQGCIWLFCMDVVMLYAEQKMIKESYGTIIRRKGLLVLPTIVLIVAFLASVLAPGNTVRMGSAQGMGAIEAILQSFRYALIMPWKEWMKWPILILLMASIPFMWYIVKKQKLSFALPGCVILLGFCFVAAAFTPCLYAQGTIEAGRLQDTVFFILIFMLYFITFYVTGWIYHKKSWKNCEKIQQMELSCGAKKWILGLFVIWVLGSLPYMKFDTGIYIGTDALYAIISGSAKEYRQVNEVRLELLKGEEENVILPSFGEVPNLLQFNDISPDPKEWLNTAMAVYYKKESVQRER